MTTKTKRSLSPHFRDVLVAWVSKEIREYRSHSVVWGSHTEHVSSTQIEEALHRGMLEVMKKTGKNRYTPDPAPQDPNRWSWNDSHWIRRTDVVVSPFKPRGPNPKYDGPFPWSLEEHWKRIEQSPVRATRTIAARLEETYARHDWTMKLQLPTIVRTRTELANTRKRLVEYFRGDFEHVWAPQSLEYLLYTGESMHLLFCDMLVQPVFVDEKLKRFEPMDPQFAMREIERITCGTNDLRVKYETYRSQAQKEEPWLSPSSP